MCTCPASTVVLSALTNISPSVALTSASEAASSWYGELTGEVCEIVDRIREHVRIWLR